MTITRKKSNNNKYVYAIKYRIKVTPNIENNKMVP